MNSGQPSLLEAIFGKQDLSSVSLDEMYEVISEFPSFNAAHFLLARKLKQQQDAAYEKEAMRTALYFNNPFWLQSLLDEGTQIRQPQSDLPDPPVSESYVKSDDGFEKYNTETQEEIKNEGNYIFESYTPIQILSDTTDELDEETEEILEEKAESESSPVVDTFQYAEPGPETVSSFDELMSKYNLEPIAPVEESPVENQSEHTPYFEPVAETEVNQEANIFSQTEPQTEGIPEQKTVGTEYASEPGTENFVSNSNITNDHSVPAHIGDRVESSEEIVNEYGIFEQITVKKINQDHDLDAFDRPDERDSSESEIITQEFTSVSTPVVENTIAVEPLPTVQYESVVENTFAADWLPTTQHELVNENTFAAEPPLTTQHELVNENTFAAEPLPAEQYESIVENTIAVEPISFEAYPPVVENDVAEDSPDKTDEHDYDSFDRPEEEEPVFQIDTTVNEEAHGSVTGNDADDTDAPVIHMGDGLNSGQSEEMKTLSDRFEEQQKSLASFQAKNADSIVFTPYHMVDYFASQGIKLVLDENPADQFGKQLKSFTDWLKVIKKIPVQPVAEKTEEKEAEQVRHFAAHSIQERDILTESMAEVLAKQGMLDNAIALYQKLSLIYPPKSAYFASRIEQLKASLP
jgi:hypothetical protein